MADPLIGIVMGSQSDWETMRAAAEVLAELGVAHEVRIVSAHRTPDRLFAYAEAAAGRGLRAIIAGAGVRLRSCRRLSPTPVVEVLLVSVVAIATERTQRSSPRANP